MPSLPVFFPARHVRAQLQARQRILAVLRNAGRVTKRNRPEELDSFVSDLVYLTPRFFIPISLLTVAFGAVSVWKGPFEFSDPWVSAGLTMFIISFLIGIAYLSPQLEKMDKIAEEGGSGSAPWVEKLNRVIFASRIELALRRCRLGGCRQKPLGVIAHRLALTDPTAQHDLA